MKKYRYYEPGENDECVTIDVTDEDIIRDYWPWWQAEMVRLNKDVAKITQENCINDFKIVHWAKTIDTTDEEQE